MSTKRTLFVTALVALLLAASGCSALQGGPSQGKEIAKQTQAAMQDVDSYTFDLTLSMTAKKTGQTIDITASGAVNAAEKRMRMNMSLMGQSMTQYIIGTTQYVNVQGVWQKRNVSGRNIWKNQQLAQQRQILNNASVSLEGNTTIGGTEVYELSVDIKEKQLMEVIQQQQGQAVSSSVSLKDVTYTMYVSHGNYHLKRITANMTMSSSGQTLNADMTVTFSDFNGDVSIELPPEAKNARSMG